MNYMARKIRLSCDFDKVKEWAEFMQAHAEEVIQSLRQENVAHEMCFYGEDEEGNYIIGVMDCDDLKKSSEVANQSQLSVDIAHRQFKEFWSNVETLAVDTKQTLTFPGTICMFDVRPA